jgi:hypothetical protein
MLSGQTVGGQAYMLSDMNFTVSTRIDRKGSALESATDVRLVMRK